MDDRLLIMQLDLLLTDAHRNSGNHTNLYSLKLPTASANLLQTRLRPKSLSQAHLSRRNAVHEAWCSTIEYLCALLCGIGSFLIASIICMRVVVSEVVWRGISLMM